MHIRHSWGPVSYNVNGLVSQNLYYLHQSFAKLFPEELGFLSRQEERAEGVDQNFKSWRLRSQLSLMLSNCKPSDTYALHVLDVDDPEMLDA